MPKHYLLVEFESNAPADKVEQQYVSIARNVHHAFGPLARYWPLRSDWSQDGPVRHIKGYERELIYDPVIDDGNEPAGYVGRCRNCGTEFTDGDEFVEHTCKPLGQKD